MAGWEPRDGTDKFCQIYSTLLGVEEIMVIIDHVTKGAINDHVNKGPFVIRFKLYKHAMPI